MSEQLAVISEVGYGMRDYHKPILWFTTHIGEAAAALQIFEQPKANEIIEQARVRDVHDLDGKVCWVEVDGGPGGTIRFNRMWKAKR